MISRNNPFAWLLPLCRGREDPEDLIHDAFLKVEEYRRKVGAEAYRRKVALSNEDEYLRATVLHLVVDQVRKERRHRRVNEPVEEILERRSLVDPIPTPEECAARLQQLDEIERRLETVKEEVKQMYFCSMAGYTYAEIAEQFGVSTRTVLRAVAEALSALTKE